MKKQILIAIAMLIGLNASVALAKTAPLSGPTKVAIAKYKAGNYTGCLQTCQDIIKRDPSNAVAYYYIAISYVQAGKKDDAIAAYGKVLSLSPNPILADYATTGKRCIETPEQCHPQEQASNLPGGDSFVDAPFTDGLSDAVRKDFQQKQLDRKKNEINSGTYLDKGSSIETTEPIAQGKPTNDEIVAALKVLNEAGINPYSQQQAISNTSQNQELAQLNMLMGNNQSGDNNSMMSMLPFMLTQNKNGTSNYSPQMMQAVMMNSMMPNIALDLGDDKDK